MSLEFQCSQVTSPTKIDPKKASTALAAERLENMSKLLNGQKNAFLRDTDTGRNLALTVDGTEIRVVENTERGNRHKVWSYSAETGEFLRSNHAYSRNRNSISETRSAPAAAEGDLLLNEMLSTKKSCKVE